MVCANRPDLFLHHQRILTGGAWVAELLRQAATLQRQKRGWHATLKLYEAMAATGQELVTSSKALRHDSHGSPPADERSVLAAAAQMQLEAHEAAMPVVRISSPVPHTHLALHEPVELHYQVFCRLLHAPSLHRDGR